MEGQRYMATQVKMASLGGLIEQELFWECDVLREMNKQAKTLYFKAGHFGVGAAG